MPRTIGYLKDVDVYKIQILAILGSIALLVFILYLIRNKKIQEGYSLLWLGISLVFLFFSVWREALDYISFAIGIAYPPAAVFLLLLMAVFMILIQFSMILTKHAENAKNMAQEYAILRMEVEALRKSLKEKISAEKGPEVGEAPEKKAS